jgi:hypothetical protein
MRFSKISIGKDNEVKLVRVDERAHAKDAIETTGVNPLPELVDGFNAFLPAFLEFMPELKPVKSELRVTTLSLGEKDGARSLQVSVSRSIEAMGAISMTTPRMVEEPEEPNGDAVYLTKSHLKLIANVEAEATRYVNGETAQGTLALGKTENEKAVDAKMAEAEVKSTRTPRAQKPATVAGNIGTNPTVQ